MKMQAKNDQKRRIDKVDDRNTSTLHNSRQP